MNKLKVVIIGCGHVAKTRHIPSFLKIKNKANLCAVCDINKLSAKQVSEQFHIPKYYTDLEEMLLKEKPDIVDVCTPPNTHSNISITSMEHGSNVIIEKPMAASINDCDMMINASKKYDKKLSVVHNQLFYPPFLKAIKLVKNGDIGNLTGVTLQQLTNYDRYMAKKDHWVHNLPGGVISETGPHLIYMSLAFINKVKSVEVLARKYSKESWILYDDYKIMLNGDNINGLITISHSNNYHASDITIFGTDSMLKLDLQSMIITRSKRKFLTPYCVAKTTLSTSIQAIYNIMNNSISYALSQPLIGHDIMISKYVDSIINDVIVPVTPQEGRETMRVMNLIVEKLDQNY